MKGTYPDEIKCYAKFNLNLHYEEETIFRFSTYNSLITLFFFLFCFVALRPKSTAMVIAGRSVHLTTLFPGQA